MDNIVGMADASADQEDVSLALSLPMEMVECILLHLLLPDLLRVAPHLPKWWQDVIECSGEIWRKIARYRYDDEVNILVSHAGRKKLSSPQAKKSTNVTLRTVKCFLKSGILFLNGDPNGKGFIWAPGSDDLSLKILDPDLCSLRHQKKRHIRYWSIKLYDLNGERVCYERVRDDDKSTPGPILEAAFGAEREPVFTKCQKPGRLKKL